MPSFNINESSKTRKIRGIRKLQEQGKGGERGAASDMIRKLAGPQLPLAQGQKKKAKPKTKGRPKSKKSYYA